MQHFTETPKTDVRTAIAPCPDKPNCVSSLSVDPRKKAVALSFEGNAQAALEKLLAIITAMPRSRVMEVLPDFVRVEFYTRVFRFKDDMTFWFDDQDKVIHLRSASRIGHFDFGVNRKRALTIAESWYSQQQGVSGVQ